jgi:hypothetical protein
MWKEAVTGWFKVLSHHFPGEAEENHENLSQYSQYPDQDFNLGPPKYKAQLIVK